MLVHSIFYFCQERLKIPLNPYEWTTAHVRHWLQWAARQFPSVSLKLADWNITGFELCNLSLQEFHTKVPHDPKHFFQTHWEILKKEKVVGETNFFYSYKKYMLNIGWEK